MINFTRTTDTMRLLYSRSRTQAWIVQSTLNGADESEFLSVDQYSDATGQRVDSVIVHLHRMMELWTEQVIVMIHLH